MSSGSSNRRSSRHSAGLLLRVTRPDGHADEFYLADGLTIGRTLANTVGLPDDDSVDRTHARVEVADDGSARLRCVEPDSSLTVDGKAVRELVMDQDVRFRIGQTEFQCVSGQRSAERPDPDVQSACPFCTSKAAASVGEGIRQCPTCREPIFSIRPDSSSQEPIVLPAVYGDYRAERYVARGGMGIVLKGYRVGSGGRVAIKVLLPGVIVERRDSERFEQEVMMMGRVRHPHVVKLLDHGKSGRFSFLALEWIEGPSLRYVIADAQRAGKLTDFTTASRWFEQVAKGLAAIHAVGIVHRDIKPSNILIGPDGAARVADLGIAKRIDMVQTSYTTTGHVPGTFEYMAPEQLHAPDTVDGRTDLYAVGVTFYELLTGSHPVGAWQPASMVNPSVPMAFDEILGRLLAPTPDRRYGDIYELLSAPMPSRSTGNGASRNVAASVLRPSTTVTGSTIRASDFTPLRGADSAEIRPWERVMLDALRKAGSFPGVADIRLKLFSLAVLLLLPLAYYVNSVRNTNLSHKYTESALQYIAMKEPDRAISDCNEAIRLNPGLATAYYIRGNAWSDKEDHDKSVADFNEAIRLDPRYAMAYNDRGYAWCVNKDDDKAVADFNEAIRLDPRYAMAYNNRGSVWLDKKDYDRAIADCSEAIRLDPGLAMAYCNRGNAWNAKMEYDKAVADCNEAIRIDPGHVEAYIIRGVAWSDKKEYDKAVADYTHAIWLRPRCAKAYNNRGNILNTRMEYDKALADFNEAIRLDPGHANTYNNRGNSWVGKKDYDKAVDDYTEAIRLDPGNTLAYSNRGNAWNAKMEYDKAVADCNEAIRIDPRYANAYNNRGIAWNAKKQYDKALADFNEAIRLDPGFAEAYDDRGYAWSCKEENDKAVADYTEAIRLDPNNPRHYANRGLFHQAKGNPDAAVADLNIALDTALRLNSSDTDKYRDQLRAAESLKQQSGR